MTEFKGKGMRASGKAASSDRSPGWSLLATACLGIALAALSGCGKSKAEREAEKATEDARYDAAVQAEQDREGKLEQRALSSPAAPAKKAPHVSAAMMAALNPRSPAMEIKTNVDTAFAQPKGSTERDLHAMYDMMMSNVRNNLPRSDTTRFYDAFLNKSHTAVCGSVDYEVTTDGVRGRSKRERFIAKIDDAVVDTGAPGVHATFDRMASAIDCTPD